ncbi:MAG: hypothetical protein HWN65_10680 [Candidatus Helarchaeota archaeon]|nr:hypothetical protein [Candidatus Helarchaeota archaeon]
MLILEVIRETSPASTREIEDILRLLQYKEILKKAPRYKTVNDSIHKLDNYNLIELDKNESGTRKNLRYRLTDKGIKFLETLHEIFNEISGYKCIDNPQCILNKIHKE